MEMRPEVIIPFGEVFALHKDLSSSPEPSRKKGLVVYAVIPVLGDGETHWPRRS